MKISQYELCLLRKRYLAFYFMDFDYFHSACQISKSRQKSGGRVKQTQWKYLLKAR